MSPTEKTLSEPTPGPGEQNHWTPLVSLVAPRDAVPSKIDVMAFSHEGLVEEKSLESVEWIASNRERFTTIWVNVEGLGDVSSLIRLGEIFKLHKLSLEDVLNPGQRPKLESYPGYYIVIMRMLQRRGLELEFEQLSLFLGQDFVLTFQDGIPGDCMGPLRARLRGDASTRHDRLASFLAYSILDSVVDSYFPVLEGMGEYLEDLEDHVLLQPHPDCVKAIHDVKRELLAIRRAVWPLRDAINPLLRDDTDLICPETKVFLRDCNDHCVQLIEIVETYREICSSLMDVYLSSLSNRMNEVMKVLAIITTIFVPLTFVAGVYGMNFDPSSSPVNMPELRAYWGYPLCLAFMLVVALGELWFFKKRGWIFSPELPEAPGGEKTANTPPDKTLQD